MSQRLLSSCHAVELCNKVELYDAITLIDELVFAKEGRHLEQVEEIVIKAAWEDKDYKELASSSPYSIDIIQRRAAPKLWFLLTGILGDGEKVTKKRLRSILEQRADTFKTTPRVIKGQPTKISNFYGRRDELSELKKIIVENRCVVLFGEIGIGKSTLAAKLLNDVATDPWSKFDYLVWESVFSGPSLQSLLADLLKVLTPTTVSEQGSLENPQSKTSALIKFLQEHRCLLILDGAEAWLEGDRSKNLNPYGEKYAEYGAFFRRIVESQHQSCLVLISREPFKDLAKLRRTRQLPAYLLKIEGLDLEAAKAILRSQDLADEHRWEDLLEPYMGNPAFIELVASRIKNFFAGRVAEFLKYKTALVNDIFREILSQQFCKPSRLTYLERRILLHLVERLVEFPVQEVSFTMVVDEIKVLENKPLSVSDFIEAIENLHDCSLIKVHKTTGGGQLHLSLQPVMERLVIKNKNEMLDSFLKFLKLPAKFAGVNSVGLVR